MLLYFTSRVISSTAAFLYPGYASFKTLSQRPASEQDLERWLMYWSVLGVIVGVEYVAEWLISWLPLYYPLKTIFLLYLSLPQTQGSSYLYITYLQPFLHTHEADIDATLVKLKARVYTYVQTRLRLLWAQILGSLGQAQNAAALDERAMGDERVGAAPPPSVNDPVSGPAQLLGGLWQSYGPTIVAQGASLFTMASAAAAAQAYKGPLTGRAPVSSANLTEKEKVDRAMLERRRQLESELASLPPSSSSLPLRSANSNSSDEAEGEHIAIPTQHGSSAYLPSPGSDADLRARGGGQYEEVEVPSDVEGYDLGPAPRRPGAGGTPGGGRRTSWFGWGAAGAGADKKDD